VENPFGGQSGAPQQEPDSGTYTLDTTPVHGGGGVIVLDRTFTATPPSSGFQSLRVTYEQQASVDVTFA